MNIYVIICRECHIAPIKDELVASKGDIMEKIATFFIDIWNKIEINFFDRLTTIGFKDVFDIVILAMILYFIVSFILDKRGMRLVVGLIVLIGIVALAYIFNWKAIKFIFENFYQYGFIGLIIMFQPELRSVLEKIGNVPTVNLKSISVDHKSSSYVTNSISILAKTAHELSLEKTGALIVIECETKLGEHIKTGTFINAQLSSQLLKNIFFDKAPLHDGAVILRGFRIYSAGCFLPLSTKEDIDENMGTRHRAAIGITEISDAISIIVSEETGSISIAHNGKIVRDLTQKTLKKELSKILLPALASKNANSNEEKE